MSWQLLFNISHVKIVRARLCVVCLSSMWGRGEGLQGERERERESYPFKLEPTESSFDYPCDLGFKIRIITKLKNIQRDKVCFKSGGKGLLPIHSSFLTQFAFMVKHEKTSLKDRSGLSNSMAVALRSS